MRMLTTFFILMLLTSTSLAQPLDANEQAYPNGSSANFLVYAVTWQPTFCLMSPYTPGCNAAPQRFLTHGVWPYSNSTNEYTNRHPQFCTNSPACQGADTCEVAAEELSKALANEDLRAWVTRDPERMFAHEWSKHGTCSGRTVEDYFQSFVDLRKAVVIDDPDAFDGMIGTATDFARIREVFPVNTAFRCYKNEKGEQYLHEVFYLIDAQGQPYLQEKRLQIGIQCEERKTWIPRGVPTPERDVSTPAGEPY
nr:hypothetical protein [uncultured Pseudomonas sp.]